ncbi:MAG: molybdopterin-guanine dinucleotide biosynthesis protein MobB [Dehalococcoidia bacterium]|uniref:molybdopterin-guanine dinucleotide biosynthesis protein MobB n=1 Tax=Candidatus Amarobacter glycogenicus TaxID=3140699 RepID=UPI003137294E|nr:molybdopterin-guanine dinucleotide biosynthesis protein MobB [Dehalococcoidia bacterium]MBK6559973.1 molybdopterin-guanine dinucleotide biosynthesis protein MobB [Dehalococcoidia bacterium]
MTTSSQAQVRPSEIRAPRPFVGPAVIAVRGPSRSGKTTMCERLIPALTAEGLRVAWFKRTHHTVDLPGKASDRVWLSSPAASVVRATDRLLLTLPPGGSQPQDMLAQLPPGIDVVLFETHEPLPYPTILSSQLDPEPSENVLGRWSLYHEDAAVLTAMPEIRKWLPADRELDMAMRAALKLHGGHGCAGLILGTRLALTGAAALGIEVPDTKKRLIVVSETDRCAVDGIQAVTGCRPGKRTLRLLDFGKLAASFLDEHTGRSVRVAARGDLRERVGATGEGRHEIQRAAYAAWPTEDLFTVRDTPLSLSQYDRPGPPRARVLCVTCGEEVSDGRHLQTELGPQCRPCRAGLETRNKGALL